MKLRLAAPAVLVDIGRIADLSYVRERRRRTVRIGALTRHHDLAHVRPASASRCRCWPQVAGQIGDPQVRHRGTIGGSMAHGDPASDLPAALLALRARWWPAGPAASARSRPTTSSPASWRRRWRPTRCSPRSGCPPCPGAGWAFEKFNRRAQDWAIVGVAAVLDQRLRRARASAWSTWARRRCGPRGSRRRCGRASAGDAAARADDGTEPPDDLNASPEFRRHLAQVLVRRALESAGA